MLLDDLIALLFDAVLWVGHLVLEVAVTLLSLAATLCMLTGRLLFRLLGRKPYREIMFLTGVTIWSVVAAFAYCVSLYRR
jgi:hypothetical protein